jgi:hypothetical protein
MVLRRAATPDKAEIDSRSNAGSPNAPTLVVYVTPLSDGGTVSARLIDARLVA